MARLTTDLDARIAALKAEAKELQIARTMQLGELVQLTGADALSRNVLVGILLAGLKAGETSEAEQAGADWFQGRKRNAPQKRGKTKGKAGAQQGHAE